MSFPSHSRSALLFVALLLSAFPLERASRAETGIYGPGIGGDALANSAVGGPVGGLRNYIRFRAEHSSPLTSVKFVFVSAEDAGYGAGTGGHWKLELVADDHSDNHYPTGTALASQPVSAQATTESDKEITFTSPYTTTKGTLYHLIFENTDANPTVNYFSIDSWMRLSFTEGGQLNPRFLNSDWGTGFFYGGVWHHRPGYTPIADIGYANGRHQGMSYGEASYACPVDDLLCTDAQLVGEVNGSTAMVREWFKVSGCDRIIERVGVRLLKTEGTTSDLVLSLRDSSDNEIDSVTIPASSVVTGDAPGLAFPNNWDDLGQSARWVEGTFHSPHTLTSGQTYYLRLSSSGGTYWAWVMRRLSADGSLTYSTETAFTDGWSEYTIDGLTWKSLGHVNKQNDLQFYFAAPSCPCDINRNTGVDGADLSTLVGNWGPCECPCPSDLNGDEVVDGVDLSILLGSWGPCPPRSLPVD